MQIQIEKLVYGGSGMARTDKGVLFVDKVLPGELVEVDIVDEKKDYRRARLTSILERSPHRRDPPCPNSETVGCCDWGHISYTEQLDLKAAIIDESLRRGGGITLDHAIERITGPETHYRLRASFHVVDNRLGFVQRETKSIVPISECTALMPPLNEFLAEAADALGQLKMAGTQIVRAIASPETWEVAAVFERGRERVRWRERDIMTTIKNLRFRLRPERFFQPNQFLLEHLMSEVIGLAGSPNIILDLFCGCGFFSLALARTGARVIGVDRRSIKNAQWNARRNKVSNVEFTKASAGTFLKKLRVRPDVVVLDPPRTGIGKATIRNVASLEAERIVYVSCNPTTFAPEARMLLDSNYELSSLKFLDQFPNTHHIEMLGLFRKA